MKIKTITLLIIICFVHSFDFAQANKKFKSLKKQNIAQITFYLKDATKSDTLLIWVFTKPLGELNCASEDYKEYQATMDLNQKFVFRFPVNKEGQYFQLTDKKSAKQLDDFTSYSKEYLSFYYAQPGDIINILAENKKDYQISNGLSLEIFGKGAAKYKCKYELESTITEYRKTRGDQLILPENKYNRENYINKIIKSGIQILAKYKKDLSQNMYNLLKADFIFNLKQTESSVLVSTIRKWSREQRKVFLKTYKNGEPSYFDSISSQVKNISINYPAYTFQQMKLNTLAFRDTIDLDQIYFTLKNKKSGILLERMKTFLISQQGFRMEKFDYVMNDALKTVQSPQYRRKLDAYKARMNGKQAYDFTLMDDLGRKVSLHNFHGRVVVIDFWYTGCSHCIEFYKGTLSNVEKKFKDNKDVVFISVSIDRGKTFWQNSVNAGDYTSKDVVNLFTGGLGAAHPINRFYNIQSFPQPIIINRNMKIVLFGNSQELNSNLLIKKITELL